MPSGHKNSGMLQFLGELTACAAGKLSQEVLEERLSARAANGRAWVEGGNRIRVTIPTAKESKLLSSFPPGFPVLAWEEIRRWNSQISVCLTKSPLLA